MQKLWIWERPCTLHLVYTAALAITTELKKAHGRPYATPFYGFFENGYVRWVCPMEDIVKNGTYVLNQYLDPKQYKKKNDEWNVLCDELESWFDVLQKKQFSDMPSDELSKIYSDFDDFYLGWWGFAQVAELISYGGEAVLQNYLEKIDKKELFHLLVTPTKKSYTNEEEEDLFAIVKEAQIHGLENEDVQKRLYLHAKEYHWIHNNYYDTVHLDFEYFKKQVQLSLEEGVDVDAFIKKNDERLINIRKEKARVMEDLNFDERIRKVVMLLDEFCIFQDFRKKLTLIADSYLDMFAREAAHRIGKPYSLVRWATVSQMKNILNRRFTDWDLLQKQSEVCVVIFTDKDNSSKFLFGEAAKKKEQDVFGIENVSKDILEIEGRTANTGRATGVARVLLNPRDINDMKEGEILVSTMTTPEFVPVMKRAAAIVTDEGGITSHAAIVSRELGIPCIIGTSIATKAIKTGDCLDVRANHGVVKIL
jgi:phosphohistidine swiveling domain-containing protein